MQQPTQPPLEAEAAPEVPTECPLSHRVARKASLTIIAALCVLIAATVIYVLTTSG